jgi:hypothetical protein
MVNGHIVDVRSRVSEFLNGFREDGTYLGNRQERADNVYVAFHDLLQGLFPEISRGYGINVFDGLLFARNTDTVDPTRTIAIGRYDSPDQAIGASPSGGDQAVAAAPQGGAADVAAPMNVVQNSNAAPVIVAPNLLRWSHIRGAFEVLELAATWKSTPTSRC